MPPGLLGGHSGLNIGEDRGNAVIFVAQLVDLLLSQVKGTKLAEIRGGDKRNALPREASATVLVRPPGSDTTFLSSCSFLIGGLEELPKMPLMQACMCSSNSPLYRSGRKTVMHMTSAGFNFTTQLHAAGSRASGPYQQPRWFMTCRLISREGALSQVPSKEEHAARRLFDKRVAGLREEYGAREPGMSITLSNGSAATVIQHDSAQQLIDLLCTLPHGVVKYSHAVPGQHQLSHLAAAHMPMSHTLSVKPTPSSPISVFHVTISIPEVYWMVDQALNSGSQELIGGSIGATPTWSKVLQAMKCSIHRSTWQKILYRQ